MYYNIISYRKNPDLILAGNVAIDGGSGQVGPRVAELLGIPYVTTITKLDIADGGNVTVVRDVEGDEEIIETSLPLLVTAQQGLNEPRYPSLPGIMKAKKKPLEELELDDLDLDEDDVEAKTKTIEVFLPPKRATSSPSKRRAATSSLPVRSTPAKRLKRKTESAFVMNNTGGCSRPFFDG